MKYGSGKKQLFCGHTPQVSVASKAQAYFFFMPCVPGLDILDNFHKIKSQDSVTVIIVSATCAVVVQIPGGVDRRTSE